MEATKFSPEIESLQEENKESEENLSKNFQVDYTSKTQTNNTNRNAVVNNLNSFDKKFKFHSVNSANIIKMREVKLF